MHPSNNSNRNPQICSKTYSKLGQCFLKCNREQPPIHVVKYWIEDGNKEDELEGSLLLNFMT
jgi:hypothetical protein